MRDSFHHQARADQFQRLADQALTATERKGYLELADRYRRMAIEIDEPAAAEPSPTPTTPPPAKTPG